MRLLILSVVAASLCVGVIGCDKPEPAQTPGPFDTSIDGSMPLPAVRANEGLLNANAPSMIEGVEPLQYDVAPEPTEEEATPAEEAPVEEAPAEEAAPANDAPAW